MMNKYKLKMKTLTGLGNEYVYVYATSNFERYLNIHNLKYARDITKDYQLTDRVEDLQQRITRAIEYIGNKNIGIPRKTREKAIAILKGVDDE